MVDFNHDTETQDAFNSFTVIFDHFSYFSLPITILHKHCSLSQLFQVGQARETGRRPPAVMKGCQVMGLLMR